MSISKLFHVGALVAFGAALFGNTVFGHAGTELLAGGLFLYASGDLAEDVLS